MSEATERDKALYQQIKDARGLYRGLAIVYLLILVACVIMAIACVITRKLHGILPLVGFASGAWFSASLAHIRYKDYASALEEIGPDPAGLDTCETYSETTAYAIETARMTKKELLQQWIAYSILTLTLLGMGALLLTFYAIWDLEKSICSSVSESAWSPAAWSWRPSRRRPSTAGSSFVASRSMRLPCEFWLADCRLCLIGHESIRCARFAS